MNRSERKLRCEKCGSEFFQDTEFRQYYAGTYSSAPGGELYAVPSETAPVRLCLCGHPVSVKTSLLGATARKSFAESLDAALRCRAQAEPETLRARLLKEFGTKEALAELHGTLAALQQIVQRWLDQTGPPNVNPIECPSDKISKEL